MCLLSFIRPNGARVQEEAEQYFEAQWTFDPNQTPYTYITSTDLPIICEARLLEDETESKAKLFLCYVRSVDEDSLCSTTTDSSTSDENSDGLLHQGQSESEPSVFDMDEYPPTSTYTPDFDPFESEVIGEDTSEEEDSEEESDELFKAYTERMRWFDILNHDRACGISRSSNHRSSTLEHK